jgi:hypothetical protein
MTSQLETRKNTNITFTQIENGKFLRILNLKKMGVLYYNMNKDKLLYRYLLKVEGCEGGLSHIPVNREFKLMPFINLLFPVVKGS